MDPNALAAASSTNLESRAANKYRFELELEFVQSLANPHYLQALAQQGIMEDPSFVLYLDYLRYWSEPEYAKFIMCAKQRHVVVQFQLKHHVHKLDNSYPHALHHLQLLQNPRFRADLKAEEVLQLLVEKQFDHWRTWYAFACSTPITSQNPTEPSGPVSPFSGDRPLSSLFQLRRYLHKLKRKIVNKALLEVPMAEDLVVPHHVHPALVRAARHLLCPQCLWRGRLVLCQTPRLRCD